MVTVQITLIESWPAAVYVYCWLRLRCVCVRRLAAAYFLSLHCIVKLSSVTLLCCWCDVAAAAAVYCFYLWSILTIDHHSHIYTLLSLLCTCTDFRLNQSHDCTALFLIFIFCHDFGIVVVLGKLLRYMSCCSYHWIAYRLLDFDFWA